MESWTELELEGDRAPGIERSCGRWHERTPAWADGISAAPVVTVYGNRDAIDLERLRKIGDVVELKPSDVVSW